MSIPTATCVPGGELVWRIGALAPDPETLVVVNCAGRTRSIMGAQSLINAGIPNRVVALRNGTMGWHLAGLALDHGQTRYLPAVSPAQAEAARRRAQAVCARFAVPRIDRATLAAWQADAGPHDVPARRALARGVPGGPPAGFRLGTGRPAGPGDRPLCRLPLGARPVLVDDDGVRAAHDRILAEADGAARGRGAGGRPVGARTLETGPGPERALGLAALRYREIAPDGAARCARCRPDATGGPHPQRRVSRRPHRRRAPWRAHPARRADPEPAGARGCWC